VTRPGDLAPPRLRALAARAAGHRRLATALLAGSAVVAAVQALTPDTAGAAGTADRAATQRQGGRPAGSLGDLTGADAATFGRTAVAVRLADPAGLVLAAPGRHVDVLAGGALPAAGAPSQEQARPGGGDPVATDAVVLAVPEPPVPAGPGDGAGDGEGSGGVPGGGGGGGLAGALGGAATAAGPGAFSGVVVLAVRPADVRGLAAGAGSRAFSLALPLAATP
jgi:hypothetical protein